LALSFATVTAVAQVANASDRFKTGRGRSRLIKIKKWRLPLLQVVEVVPGVTTHNNLKTWETPLFQEIIQPSLTDEQTRLSYD